jgi:hypothetical protein
VLIGKNTEKSGSKKREMLALIRKTVYPIKKQFRAGDSKPISWSVLTLGFEKQKMAGINCRFSNDFTKLLNRCL